MKKVIITIIGIAISIAIAFMAFGSTKPSGSEEDVIIRNGVVYYATDDMEVLVNRSDTDADVYDIYLCQYFGGRVDSLEYRGRFVQSNLLDGVNDTVEYYYEHRQ